MGNGLPKFPDADRCNGCQACVSVCPAGALRMVPDAEGFAHPQVDDGKCLGCGKCVRTCPVLSPPGGQPARKAWSAVSTRREEVMRSSSGAIFQLLASKILAAGGVVFGARFDGEFNVVLDSCEDLAGLVAFQGSKYLQSSANGVYSRAEAYLNAGRTVLFSGTPCQIAALRKVLGGNDWGEKLITVGVICHGAPSPLIWQEFRQARESVAGAATTTANFRDKCLSWLDFSMTMTFANGGRYSCILKHDPYIRGFLQHLFLRPSCHACQFRDPNWTQDITLADFWKVKKLLPQMYEPKGGVSLVFAHSDLGERLLESVSGEIERIEVPLEASMASNPASMVSAAVSPYRRAFWEDHGKYPLLKLLRWYNYRRWWKTVINMFPEWRRRQISRQIPDSRPKGKH